MNDGASSGFQDRSGKGVSGIAPILVSPANIRVSMIESWHQRVLMILVHHHEMGMTYRMEALTLSYDQNHHLKSSR